MNACGYVDGQHGVCNTTGFGRHFEPFPQIMSDVPVEYKST